MPPNVVLKMAYAMTQDKIMSTNMGAVKKAKYLRERKFYGCGQADDFIDYVDNGITNGDILGYTANPEKTSGVFNENGLLGKKDKAALRKDLRKTQSNIWHAVISFEENFGKKHLPDCESALELLQAELPSFFKNIGIRPDNAIWFAGLHENTDNRHIHLSFYEREPLFYSAKDKSHKHYRYGRINENLLDRFKVNLECRLTDVAFNLKQSRRALTQAQKKSLNTAKTDGNDFERGLRKRLLNLYRVLPTEGRVSYNSLNMAPLRGQIRAVVNYIVKSDKGVRSAFERFGSDCAERDYKVRQICERQKIEDFTPYLIEDKYSEDVYRRLGDMVIKAALAVKRKQELIQKKSRSHARKKRVEKQHRKFLLNIAMTLSRDVIREAVDIFEEYRRKLANAEYGRLIEEGEIQAE